MALGAACEVTFTSDLTLRCEAQREARLPLPVRVCKSGCVWSHPPGAASGPAGLCPWGLWGGRMSLSSQQGPVCAPVIRCESPPPASARARSALLISDVSD